MSQQILLQVLAALLATPARVAQPIMHTLDTKDFQSDWRAARVYDALLATGLPEQANSGAALIRINSYLLEAGEYSTEREAALRDYLTELVGTSGDSHHIHALARTIIINRYRDYATDFAHNLAHHAANCSTEELDQHIATGIQELRRLRSRLPADRPVTAVTPASA